MRFLTRFLGAAAVSASVLISGLANAAPSMSGVWTMHLDTNVDGAVTPQYTRQLLLTSSGSTFAGVYIGIPSDSTFAGRFFQEVGGNGGVLVMTQSGSGGVYLAAIALHAVSDTLLVGTWCDMKGNAGDLELTH